MTGGESSGGEALSLDYPIRVDLPPGRETEGKDDATRSASPARRAFRRFWNHRLAALSVAFVVVLCAVAVAAPLISTYDPNAIDLSSVRQPPSITHWLGTDSTGRDVWSRVVYGARVSLIVGGASAASAALIGTLMGLAAALAGKRTDAVIMRLVDIVLSFPSLMVILLLVSVLGPSLGTIIGVVAILEWPTACRIVRQGALALREAEFVAAARAIGANRFQIAFRHVLPGVLPPLTVVSALLSGSAILLEASLSFLGLGVRQPQASWGGMLNEAQSVTILREMPWLWIPPGVAIALTVLAINFIGDGLRDAIDPRQEM